MAELASLQIKVIRDGIEQAQKALNDLARAADNAEREVDGFGKKTDETNKKTKTFSSEIIGYAKAFAGLYAVKQAADALVSFAGASITASAAMEQNRVAFTTMLGSAEKAKTLLGQMQDFAQSTPFSFNEITTAGKQMIAFGFQAGEVISNLRMLGDVSAGLSQPVGDMVYLFGQIKTQGRAMTQDLMQFANRGVPIYDELAKVLKVNVSQVKDFASQGKIGFKEVELAFKNMTSEGGKFAGLMAAQAETLSGKWSNLGDAIDKILVKTGDEAMPGVKALVDELSRGAKDTGIIAYELGAFGSILSVAADGAASVLKYFNDIGDRSVTIENSILEKQEEKRVLLKRLDHQARGILGVSAEEINQAMKQVALLDQQIQRWKDIKAAMTAATTAEVLYTTSNHDMSRNPNKPTVSKNGNPNTSSSGSGTPQWVKDQEYINNIYKNSLKGVDAINAKYDEQIAKLDAIIARKNPKTEMAAFEAQMILMKQRNEELDKFNTVSMRISNNIFGKGTDQAREFSKVLDGIGSQLASMSLNAAADGFEKIGEAWGKGELNGKAFKQIMAQVTMQILEMLPMLFVSAGLQLCIAGNWPVGLGFIALGMAGAVGVGYIKGRVAKEEAQQSSTQAAHGAVFGFAKGGSFTNEIVNSPTRFAFAKGGGIASGLMGEAGTEAVVPLKRMSNGNLGVESNGGGEVNVTIINGSGEPVNIKKERNSSGGQDIAVTVGAIVSKQLSNGTYDDLFKTRYGVSRRGI